MRIAKQYLIRGLVQGVGFRVFAQNKARQLGLSGWVRNLEDGSVLAMAEGRPERIEEFEKLLRQGPQGARVDQFLQKNVEPAYRGRFDILS